MTTYRLYRCNLCRDYIKPSDSASKEGFGVHFNHDKRQPISLKRAHETEHHICLECARGIEVELRKITPAEAAP